MAPFFNEVLYIYIFIYVVSTTYKAVKYSRYMGLHKHF